MSRFAPVLVVSALLSVAACGVLAPAKSPEAELFDCRASALESLMGDREAAVTAARDIYSGRKSLTAIVAGLAPARERVVRLLSDLEKCEHPGTPADAGPASAGSEVVQ